MKNRILNFKEMKLVFVISLVIMMCNFCHSQVMAVKQFDDNEYICSSSNFEGVNLYATFTSTSNQIKIYDANHNMVQSLTYNSDEYLNRVYIYGLSRDVFNSNNNIEFLIQHFNGKGESKVQLIDDQHKIIQEFSSAGIRTIGNRNYIVESVVESKTDLTLMQAIMNQTDRLYSINGKFRKIRH